MSNVPGVIAIFFALLLAALIVALIFRPNFRDAVLGGPGEASILGLISVKGVAIVLLCGLLIGGILFVLKQSPPDQSASGRQGKTPNTPVKMRLNVHFDPADVNPRNPKFRVVAFIKTSGGRKNIPVNFKVTEGGLSVILDVPDMKTPFYIQFHTPKGVWQTHDYSIEEALATAYKMQQE